MAIKVSLINRKGGVGKSTLAVNLAWQFAGMRIWSKKVLLVDLDPQFNASQYLLGVRRYEAEIYRPSAPTVWHVFEQFTRSPGSSNNTGLTIESAIRRVVTYQSGSRIDLVPSQLELSDTLRNPAQKEYLLDRFISEVENMYDLVLFDCPPTESLFTTSAYLSSDYLLVPVKPDFLSTIGLELLARSIADFHNQFPDNQIQLAGVVFNSTSGYSPEETLSKRSVHQVAQQYGWYVFDKEVGYSRSYSKGAREGTPIFRTRHTRRRIASEFHSFAHEFANRVGL